MSKGKVFESFVDSIEKILNSDSSTTVEKNIHLPTKNGSIRQIDVLLTHQSGRHIFKTIIECKDWKRKVDIKVIEEFASKIKAVEVDKGILISKSGFTSGLLREAKQYPFISLYTIEEVDKAKEEILDFSHVGVIKIVHTSNDWTVRFVKKKEINNGMKLKTKLKFHEDDVPFDITEITQSFLQINKDLIMDLILKDNKIAAWKINKKIIFDIDLPAIAFFEENQIKTYVTGFRSVIETTLDIHPVLIDAVYKYQNLTQDETVALVLNLTMDEKTHKLILETS